MTNTFKFEDDPFNILKIGARQISDCAQDRITFEDFLSAYGDLYDKYALDGHELDDEDLDQAIMNKYSADTSLHKEIRYEILYRITDDVYMTSPEVQKAGFIAHEVGMALVTHTPNSPPAASPNNAATMYPDRSDRSASIYLPSYL